jgi:hypothetical protein
VEKKNKENIRKSVCTKKSWINRKMMSALNFLNVCELPTLFYRDPVFVTREKCSFG